MSTKEMKPIMPPYEGFHWFSRFDISEIEKHYAFYIPEAYMDLSYVLLGEKSDEWYKARYKIIFDEMLKYQKKNNTCFICDKEVLRKLGFDYDDWHTLNTETNVIVMYSCWLVPARVFLAKLKKSLENLINCNAKIDLTDIIETINGYIQYTEKKIACTKQGEAWI